MATQSQPAQPLVTTDCLSPVETLAKASGIGVAKCTSPLKKTIVLAIFAGAFIALGAMYYTFVTADKSLSFAVSKVLGGFVFCLGLLLVLVAGAELFTGNNLASIAWADKKITTGQLLKNWVVVWLGNFVGSVIIVFLLHLIHFGAFHDHAVAINMAGIAAAKINQAWHVIFIKAIFCNFLVCLAVWVAFAGRTVADKVAGILLPITAFVACGFEHSVANMYFLPMGYVAANFGGIPTHQAAWDVINASGIAWNLSAATLGNIVGGAIFVGLAYWFAFKKPAQ